jgi:hypothetical protein
MATRQCAVESQIPVDSNKYIALIFGSAQQCAVTRARSAQRDYSCDVVADESRQADDQRTHQQYLGKPIRSGGPSRVRGRIQLVPSDAREAVKEVVNRVAASR